VKLIVSYSSKVPFHLLTVVATLRLAEHVTNLYLHEIALHQNQGSADLQPPYISDTLSPTLPSGAKKDVPVGPAHIGALGDCLTATHGILDTILSIELDILLTLPVIFCKFPFSHCQSPADKIQVYERYTPSSA
jgi:hypothetical protein